jgi:hypothetical protein
MKQKIKTIWLDEIIQKKIDQIMVEKLYLCIILLSLKFIFEFFFVSKN